MHLYAKTVANLFEEMLLVPDCRNDSQKNVASRSGLRILTLLVGSGSGKFSQDQDPDPIGTLAM